MMTTPKRTILAARPRQDNRGVWRVREDDLMEFIEAAYEKTAQRIAVWQIPEETAAGD